jgi:hypothetical protein
MEKIAFAKRPAREKSKFQCRREVKVKRSRYGVGVALLCGSGFDSLSCKLKQLSHAFLFVYISLRGG